MTYEAVIGLEIHAQLLTATKIFCGCSTAFGAPPNANVCPVCLGFPGVLPVVNRAAVDLARKQGAKSFELRSSVALAHVMVDRGLSNEAKTLVRNIREQFSEGFETQDLRDADSFLGS